MCNHEDFKIAERLFNKFGFLVCNAYGAIISKNDLSDPIEQEYLCFIEKKKHKR